MFSSFYYILSFWGLVNSHSYYILFFQDGHDCFFLFCFVLTYLQVMYDASGVRLHAGHQAGVSSSSFGPSLLLHCCLVLVSHD